MSLRPLPRFQGVTIVFKLGTRTTLPFIDRRIATQAKRQADGQASADSRFVSGQLEKLPGHCFRYYRRTCISKVLSTNISKLAE